MSHTSPFSPLTLPNGSTIPNRIAKAAMEENIAIIETSQPSDEHFELYRCWAEGGAGLIITGHVMIDGSAMAGPGEILLENAVGIERFERWAAISKSEGAQVLMQLNHPGRQVKQSLGQESYAPSPIPISIGSASRLFCVPKEMSEEMIERTVQRFVSSALLAEKAGFDGVQIHSAHGYLLSQFLSPLANQRVDKWGGSLVNRSRLLCTVIQAIRSAVGPTFTLSVKLNSADFQRGGFSTTDAIEVVRLLNNMNVDLLELSGGSFEVPVMGGQKSKSESTVRREAYFLDFASDIAKEASMPVMLTGGISTLDIIQTVLDSGIHVVGMATALAMVPDLPNRLKRNEPFIPPTKTVLAGWSDRTLASSANQGVVKWYLRKHSRRSAIRWEIWPIFGLLQELYLDWKRCRLFKRVRKSMRKTQ